MFEHCCRPVARHGSPLAQVWTLKSPASAVAPYVSYAQQFGPYPHWTSKYNDSLPGFTTQQGKTSEIATSSLSLPRNLVGQDTVIHTRRPEAWTSLSETDAALFDFLRHGGRFSELNEQDTNRKTPSLLSERDRFRAAPRAPSARWTLSRLRVAVAASHHGR